MKGSGHGKRGSADGLRDHAATKKMSGQKNDEQAKTEHYLMSPSFLLIAEPTVEKAAEVFCPA